MSSWAGLVDTYTLRARLFPCLIVSLPLALIIASAVPVTHQQWGAAAGIAAAFGLPTLLAQIGRDRGRRRQAVLFDGWGGKPTTRALRHRDSWLDATTLERYHQRLSHLCPDVTLPSPEDEAADPKGADATYDSCTRFLIAKTRDRSRFPLVFAENVNYGFRRNLWGWKSVGVFVALISVVACLGLVAFELVYGASLRVAAFGGFGVSLFLLVVWWRVVNTEWVRVPAEAYAERLLETCDEL